MVPFILVRRQKMILALVAKLCQRQQSMLITSVIDSSGQLGDLGEQYDVKLIKSDKGQDVLPPGSSDRTAGEAVPVVEMPVVVPFPDHMLVDENNRALTEYDFNAILNHPQVFMLDRSVVEKKLRTLVDDGKENVMVISDFDYTLSRFEDSRGRKCWTTHGVFDNCVRQIDPELAKKFQLLKDKFFPIEFDPNLTTEQKIPYMEECDQADYLIRRLHQLDVPLVVFSAGIGNIIEMFLKNKLGQIPGNMRLISNIMTFDEQDIAVSFSEPLIHTFSKNSSVIHKDGQFFREFSERANIILLGDSMGDIHMDVGVEKKALTLKIGFLNSDVSNLLDHYMEVYDIVLVQDQSMQIPNHIVEAIANGFVKSPSYCSPI